MARGRGVPGRANQDEEEKFCPLCIEPLDSTEQQFYPCPCGYQLCLFCYDRIKLECSNLCPGCRTEYGSEKDPFKKTAAARSSTHVAASGAQTSRSDQPSRPSSASSTASSPLPSQQQSAARSVAHSPADHLRTPSPATPQRSHSIRDGVPPASSQQQPSQPAPEPHLQHQQHPQQQQQQQAQQASTSTARGPGGNASWATPSANGLSRTSSVSSSTEAGQHQASALGRPGVSTSHAAPTAASPAAGTAGTASSSSAAWPALAASIPAQPSKPKLGPPGSLLRRDTLGHVSASTSAASSPQPPSTLTDATQLRGNGCGSSSLVRASSGLSYGSDMGTSQSQRSFGGPLQLGRAAAVQPDPDGVALLSSTQKAVAEGRMTSAEAAKHLVAFLRRKEMENGRDLLSRGSPVAPPGFPAGPSKAAPPGFAAASAPGGAGKPLLAGGQSSGSAGKGQDPGPSGKQAQQAQHAQRTQHAAQLPTQQSRSPDSQPLQPAASAAGNAPAVLWATPAPAAAAAQSIWSDTSLAGLEMGANAPPPPPGAVPDQLQALWGAVSLPGLDPAAERPRGRLPLYARGGDTAATDSSGDGPFGSEQQANGCASPTATSRAQEQASGGAAFLDAADLAANGLGFVSSGYRSDGPGGALFPDGFNMSASSQPLHADSLLGSASLGVRRQQPPLPPTSQGPLYARSPQHAQHSMGQQSPMQAAQQQQQQRGAYQRSFPLVNQLNNLSLSGPGMYQQ